MNAMRIFAWVLAGILLGAVPALAAAPSGGEEPSLISGPSAGLVTALTTLLVFALLLAVLGKFAWGPIASGLRAREERIRRDLQDAEAASARAQATLAEYNNRLATAENEVRAMIAKAIEDGNKAAQSIRMQATTEAEEARQRATREIEAARKQALSEIYASAAEISTSIAEKILRKNINADDQRRLVQESLNQFQTVES